MATMGNPLGGGTDPFGNSSTWARQWAGGGQGGWSGAYGGPANTLPPGYGMTPGMFAGYGVNAGYGGGGTAAGGPAPTTPGGSWWSSATTPGGNQPGYGPGATPGLPGNPGQAPAPPPPATPDGQQRVDLAGGAPVQAPPTGFRQAPAPGQPGANLFSGYDDLGQLYWNQNPGQAWAHAWSQLGPNVASPYWNWGMQQQSRYNDQYLAQAALPGQANLTFTDFINQHAPGFATEFGNLPASQRGVTLPYLAAGRLG